MSVNFVVEPYDRNLTYFELTKRPVSRWKKYKKIIYIIFSLIGIGLIAWLIFPFGHNTIPHQPNRTLTCSISEYNLSNPYPFVDSPTNATYYLAFNTTIMQAIYVTYIQPSITNSCKTCKRFKKDPYGINNLSNDDYIRVGYDRGHLVPNADYGVDTFIISNAVPMLPMFNQQIWLRVEQTIREEYKGKLIFKGCDYSDMYVNTSLGNKLYIPLGCGYAIFNSNNLTQNSNLEILDYGYLENKNISVFKKKLMNWVEKCD